MNFKKIVFAFTMLLTVSKAYSLELVNSKNPSQKVKATLTESNNTIIQLCSNESCMLMGSSEGYSYTELDERDEELRELAKAENETNIKILGYGVLIGSVAGGVFGFSREAGTIQEFIAGVEGAFIGGISGLIVSFPVAIIKEHLYDKSKDQADALAQARPDTENEVIEISNFNDFLSDLSMALSGIN